MTSADRRTLALAVAVVALHGGCARDHRRTGDLEQMRASRELRVLVRPGMLAAPLRSSSRADQRILLQQLAARLGLELRLVEAERYDQLLPALLAGHCDLAAASFSPAALDSPGVAVSAPVDWVADLVVAGPRLAPRSLAEVALFPLHLQPSRARWLLPPGTTVAGAAPRLAPVEEDVPVEEVLRRVALCSYPSTVVDSSQLEMVPGEPLRVLGPVGGRRPLVWAVRAANPTLLAAVNGFLLDERPVPHSGRVAACRDLDLIRATRTLRVVTRSGPTTWAVGADGERGFEYELARAFASRLRARLQLVFPPPDVDPVDWLESGYGDLAALHEPAAPSRAGAVRLTAPVRRADLVSVLRADEAGLAVVDELAGLAPVASGPVAELCGLLPLEPPLEPPPMPLGSDALTALHRVACGDAQVAVVDEDVARLELPLHPELRRGPVVLPRVELVWAVSSAAPGLQRAADDFLADCRRSGLLRDLEETELGLTPSRRARPARPVPSGALSPFDDTLRAAGRSVGVDWRLLAAVVHEESRFDPTAIGPGGAAGLFQLMPATQSALGVDDPHHPEQAAQAGARYLRQLLDLFADVPERDRLALAVAAYNCGPAHVVTARRLAREAGLDPDRWTEGVERAMLELDDPEVARRYPSGVCPCRRAVGYARRTLEQYRSYSSRFPAE